MRILLRLLVVLFLPLAARGEIVFSGYLAVKETPVFNLTDEATNSNVWVRLKETFQGYTLSTFDAESKTLTLTKGEAILELRLSSAGPAAEAPAKAAEVAAAPKTEAEYLALAGKLAEAGDEQIGEMLARYQAGTGSPAHAAAQDFLKMRVIALVKERLQQSNRSD